MSCSREWDRIILFQIFPRPFVTGPLKDHRENVLFEREKGMLPATQREALFMKTSREAIALRRGFINEAKDAARAAGKFRIRVPNEVHQIDDFMRDFRNKYSDTIVERPKKNLFVRKCPLGNCKGFLNGRFHCELCQKNTCKACNEEKGPGHECDPEAVETMKLLAADTKPCPKCGCMIYRSSGCLQMWCIECHTAFDWNTGEIETKVIHNPHYYEYQRRNGTLQRNPGDVPQCDAADLPMIWQVLNVRTTLDAPILDVHRTAGELIQYRRNIQYRERRDQENKPNRIEYMLGNITEDQFKFRIQKREKAKVSRFWGPWPH